MRGSYRWRAGGPLRHRLSPGRLGLDAPGEPGVVEPDARRFTCGGAVVVRRPLPRASRTRLKAPKRAPTVQLQPRGAELSSPSLQGKSHGLPVRPRRPSQRRPSTPPLLEPAAPAVPLSNPALPPDPAPLMPPPPPAPPPPIPRRRRRRHRRYPRRRRIPHRRHPRLPHHRCPTAATLVKRSTPSAGHR